MPRMFSTEKAYSPEENTLTESYPIWWSSPKPISLNLAILPKSGEEAVPVEKHLSRNIEHQKTENHNIKDWDTVLPILLLHHWTPIIITKGYR